MLEPQETDKYIKFFFRKGTAEVIEFNFAEVDKNHMRKMRYC